MVMASHHKKTLKKRADEILMKIYTSRWIENIFTAAKPHQKGSLFLKRWFFR